MHISMGCCFCSSISKQRLKRQRVRGAVASMEVENSNTIFSSLEEVKAMMKMMMINCQVRRAVRTCLCSHYSITNMDKPVSSFADCLTLVQSQAVQLSPLHEELSTRVEM